MLQRLLLKQSMHFNGGEQSPPPEIVPFPVDSGPHLIRGSLDPPESTNLYILLRLLGWFSHFCKVTVVINRQTDTQKDHATSVAGDRGITAENMEKSQHTDFIEDTTNESASVACSNVRL